MKNIFLKYFLFISINLLLIILFTSCDKEVSRSPVAPSPPQGFLYVTSTPSGSTIFQNGRNTGRKTPDSLSYIEAGVYEITLKRTYFKDTTVIVNVSEDQLTTINVDYLSNPAMYGSLNLITRPPGANIVINDSSLSKITPVIISNLFPGKYRIKFQLYNYRDFEIEGIVQSSQIKTYSNELRDTSVWVDYQIFNTEIQSNSLSLVGIDNANVKWIGSLNNGLIKYDETNFTDFNIYNSQIPDNKINCVSVDAQNNIWIGTDFGIGVFNGSSWTIYNRSNSPLTSELINIIRFDNSGQAWIGTAGNLAKFDGINWTIYQEALGRDWIEDIYIESENKLWLGTKANGIFIFESESYIELSRNDYNYPTNSISSIAADQSGDLWFCFLNDTTGRGGLSRWDGTGFNTTYLGTADNSLNHIVIDENNNKWISTSEGFVWLDAANSLQFFTTLNSLISSSKISSSVIDPNRNVWITTIGGGLNKYKPPR